MTTNDETTRREMRDRQAARILESSMLIRILERAIVGTERAARASYVAASARRGIGAWRHLPRAQRRFLSGVLWVTAAITHPLAVTLAGKAPPGWLWMVPPAIAVMIGVTLIAASGDQSRESS